MSPETMTLLVAILTVGVALAGLMVALFACLRQDMHQFERRMNEKLDSVRDELLMEIRKTRDELRSEIRKTRNELRSEVNATRDGSGSEITRKS